MTGTRDYKEHDDERGIRERMNIPREDICTGSNETIFDRCWWLYALCRERLFADHTRSISELFCRAEPVSHQRVLLEVGCGPGFYSLRFAELFPHFEIVGLDPSPRLLAMARAKAEKLSLRNCRFVRAEAQHLADFPAVADFIIASRLFLILRNRRPVLEAMHSSLRPGGLLFIAEPLSPLRAMVPMTAMRLLRPLTRHLRVPESDASCCVLSKADFTAFVASLPWKRVEHWADGTYQYALCEKAI